MALHRLDADAGRLGDVDALLHDALRDAAHRAVAGDRPERLARQRRQSREGAVDEEFGPARADKIFFDGHLPHAGEQLAHVVEVVTRPVGAQRKGERGRIGRQFGGALPAKGRAPSDRAAEHAVRAQHLRQARLGQPVLTGAERAVVRQKRLQKPHDLFVLPLLCHQQDDIVFALHFRREQRADGLCELHRPADRGALFPQGGDVFFIAIDQIDLSSRAGDEGAEHRSHSPRAVDGTAHKNPPNDHLCVT